MMSMPSRKISGLLHGLNISNPDEVQIDIRVEKDQQGFGFQLKGDFPVRVATVRNGCPAYRQNLRPMDKIMKIDGEDVTKLTHNKVIELIRKHESFFLTVSKSFDTDNNTTAVISRPSCPGPIDDPHEQTLVAGYEVICSMISAASVDLASFQQELRKPSVSEEETGRLNNLVRSTSFTIETLRKKVPKDYLDQIASNDTAEEDVSLCEDTTGTDITSHLRELAFEVITSLRHVNSEKSQVKRCTSMPKFDRMDSNSFESPTPKLCRSETDLKVVAQSESNECDDNSRNSTLRPLISTLRDEKEDSSNIASIISNPHFVSKLQCDARQLIRDSPQDSRSCIEFMKMLFFAFFYSRVIESKETPEEHAAKELVLANTFLSERSVLKLELVTPDTMGDSCFKFFSTCQQTLSTLMDTLKLENFDRELAWRLDIEKEMNFHVKSLEKMSVIPQKVLSELCNCCVTFLTMNNLKFKNKLNVVSRRSSYIGIYNKKHHHQLPSPLSMFGLGHHSFQPFTTTEATTCSECKAAIPASVSASNCVRCQKVAHNDCFANISSSTCISTRWNSSKTSLNQEDTDAPATSKPQAFQNVLRPAASVRRAGSMRTEGQGRKSTYRDNYTRNKSDPAPNAIAEASGLGYPTRPRMRDEGSEHSVNTSESTSSLSVNLSQSSLSPLEDIDEKVVSMFSVPASANSDFDANDSFSTADQIIPKKVYKRLSKEEKKQQNILLEFLNSERKQTFNLKLLKRVFGPVLRDREHDDFREINLMVHFHFSFYNSLVKCVDQNTMMHQNCAPVFLDFFENRNYRDKFLVYYKWQCQKETIKGERVRKIEQEKKNVLQKRNLKSIIASEFQRATKYKLLMQSLAQSCSESERETYKKAVEVVAALTSDINSDKGLHDYHLIVKHIDKSEVLRTSDKSTYADSPQDNEAINNVLRDMREMDLMALKPILYGSYYGLMRFLPSGGSNKSQEYFKYYTVFLYEHCMIFAETDPESNKVTWKPFFLSDRKFVTLVYLKDLKHATTSNCPLSEEQSLLVSNAKISLMCAFPSFLFTLFVSTGDERQNWLGKLCVHTKRPAAQYSNHTRKMNLNRSQSQAEPETPSAGSTLTDSESFDFSEKVTFSASDLIEEGSEETKDEIMEKIAVLRRQVQDNLNQSFSLARAVFDPGNSLEPDKLLEVHSTVVTEEVTSLVDFDLWMKEFKAPLGKLEGQLSAEDLEKMPAIEYFMEEDAAKHVEARIVDLPGEANTQVVASNYVTSYSDDSSQANEVHMHTVSGDEMMQLQERLRQKLDLTSSELSIERECDDEASFTSNDPSQSSATPLELSGEHDATNSVDVDAPGELESSSECERGESGGGSRSINIGEDDDENGWVRSLSDVISTCPIADASQSGDSHA